MFSKLDNIQLIYIAIFILLFLATVFVRPIIFYTTQFTEVITIKDKHQLHKRDSTKYLVVNENDTIYNLVNVWWKGDFDKSDDWVQMKIGKTYKIQGYGFRFPMLSWYKNIHSFEEV